jgi:hypothetical protein
VYAPPVSKMYIIYNNSGYTATLYNSTVIGNTTPAGSGIAIPNGSKYVIFSDATNFYKTDTNPGTVTSVGVSGGTTGLTTSGGPVTGSGTITLGGTLAVGSGGTGAATFTANALLKGNGTGAVTSASGADITSQIGTNAVTNATNATNALNLVTTNFTVQESGGKLIIKYGGTTILSVNSSGDVTATGSFVAGGTP